MQRILVIEDENDIRQLLRFNLEREGFAVLEAADGLGGLHMATSELPDLVVLDRDLFTVPHETIRDIRVELTMADGRVTYRRPESALAPAEGI